MRIGLITGEYPPMQGGVADFTRELAVAFVALGHEVFVLTDQRGGGLMDEGVRISAGISNWNRSSWQGVRRWIKTNQLDVVNLQYQTAAYNMAPLIHLLPHLVKGTPFVTTFHDLRVPYLFPKAGPLRDWWVLRLARDAAVSIVTNIADEYRLLATDGVDRVERIPIGSNITSELPPDYDREQWRKQLKVKRGETLLAFFGFLNRSKGVDVLLRAISGQKKARLRLVIIGDRTGDSDPTNAAYAQEINELIDELALSRKVSWTGYVTSAEVSGYLTASDACVLPYLDGVSLRRGTLMAALALGCPIVSTMPEVAEADIVDGVNMLLVPPGDEGALGSALADIAADTELREQLGAGARQLSRLFTWEHIAARTVEVYEDLLN